MVNQKIYSDLKDDQLAQLIQQKDLGKRSFFQQYDNINWMRSRKTNCSPKYLYDYSTLNKIMTYKQVFQAFDEDKSDAREMTKMFEINNLYLSKQECQQIFRLYDKNNGNELILDGSGISNHEFKICVLSDDMNKLYQQIRSRVMSELEAMPVEISRPYVPISFDKMIELCFYRKNRQSVIDLINSKKISTFQEFSFLIRLFDETYKIQKKEVVKKPVIERFSTLKQADQAQKIMDQYKDQLIQEKEEQAKLKKEKEQEKLIQQNKSDTFTKQPFLLKSHNKLQKNSMQHDFKFRQSTVILKKYNRDKDSNKSQLPKKQNYRILGKIYKDDKKFKISDIAPKIDDRLSRTTTIINQD